MSALACAARSRLAYAPGVTILDTWHTLGMRGTGSHDAVLDDVFVPEAAVSGRRPQGRWHHRPRRRDGERARDG